MIQQRLHDLSLRYIRLAERRTGLLLAVFAVLAALLIVPISKLELHTDLAELLPNDHPAVHALRRISGKQISSTNLVVIIESPDATANQRFAEALRPEFERMRGSVFTEVQFEPETEVPAYAHKYMWLYASREDLTSAETLLDRIVARRKSPLLVDFEGDPEADLKSLRERLNQKLPPQTDAKYFQQRAGKTGICYLGIMLWRRGDGLATLGDHQTLTSVEQVIARMDKAKFHPQLKVEYSGAIAMAIDEHNAVRDDLTMATGVCVTLVMLAIFLYFRRVGVLLVVGAPAVLGLLMALALARFTIEYLNANTAFLISIILGNGINTPIIFLARYGEERRAGQPVREALTSAMATTIVATIIAATAASISYGCLLWTNLRGFNQFGLIGGAGMLFVFVVTFLLVPPMVIQGERWKSGLLTPPPTLWRGPFALIGRASVRAPWLLASLSFIVLAVSMVPAIRYLRDPLEYNFNNLRTNDEGTNRRWQIMYDLGMGNLGAGHIARDGVLLVDSPEQADVVADALWQQDQALGEKRVLEAVRTINKVLPQDQDAKLEILGRIRSKIDKHRELMDEAEWKDVQAWRPPDTLRKIGVPDLPRRLRENFTEVDGHMGRFVGIDADPSRYIEGNGLEMIRLSKALRVDALGKTWVAASSSTVFAGMIETIMKDGPRVIAASAIGVAVLLLIAFGPRGAPLVLFTLLTGMLWLTALLGIFQWKLNFLNFVAMPITIGVGADYAANLWARIRTEGTTHLADIVADTGSAGALCSTTTIIGYSSLMLARNRALQSFGHIAVLGEVTCLVAALLFMPALVLLLKGRKRSTPAL